MYGELMVPVQARGYFIAGGLQMSAMGINCIH